MERYNSNQLLLTNKPTKKRMYGVYLELENIEHTDMVFEQFLQENGKEICPGHGVVTYVDGKVKCSVHTKEDDGDIPFL